MSRQSKFTPSDGADPFEHTQSPKVFPIQSFIGLGIILTDPSAEVTARVGGSRDGEFITELLLEGSGTFRYPAASQTHLLHHSPFIEIEWDKGFLRIFQKA